MVGLGCSPKGVDTRRCTSKDTGPRRGVDCENLTLVGEENETPFIRVWKPFPIKRVLKTLRESPKEKEDNIC